MPDKGPFSDFTIAEMEQQGFLYFQPSDSKSESDVQLDYSRKGVIHIPPIAIMSIVTVLPSFFKLLLFRPGAEINDALYEKVAIEAFMFHLYCFSLKTGNDSIPLDELFILREGQAAKLREAGLFNLALPPPLSDKEKESHLLSFQPSVSEQSVDNVKTWKEWTAKNKGGRWNRNPTAPWADCWYHWQGPPVLIQIKQSIKSKRNTLTPNQKNQHPRLAFRIPGEETKTTTRVSAEHYKCALEEDHLFVYWTDHRDAQPNVRAVNEIVVDIETQCKPFGACVALLNKLR